MKGTIRIEIEREGTTQVFLGEPRENDKNDQLWQLYTALKPKIRELQGAAMHEGNRIALQLRNAPD